MLFRYPDGLRKRPGGGQCHGNPHEGGGAIVFVLLLCGGGRRRFEGLKRCLLRPEFIANRLWQLALEIMEGAVGIVLKAICNNGLQQVLIHKESKSVDFTSEQPIGE